MVSMEFVLEEATIADLHKAIREGRTTCTQVVQRYIERCQRYNGVATVLVTADGAPVSNGLTGSIRAHNPLAFPPQTIPVSEVLPDFHHYQGPPPGFGAHGHHGLRSSGSSANGDGSRHSSIGSTECAVDVEHSRRALGDLQG